MKKINKSYGYALHCEYFEIFLKNSDDILSSSRERYNVEHSTSCNSRYITIRVGQNLMTFYDFASAVPMWKNISRISNYRRKSWSRVIRCLYYTNISVCKLRRVTALLQVHRGKCTNTPSWTRRSHYYNKILSRRS